MLKPIFKSKAFIIYILLMFFTISSNQHIIYQYINNFKSKYALELEKSSEKEKNTPDDPEDDEKESNDYFVTHIEFHFKTLKIKPLEKIYLENIKCFSIEPTSPPPEPIHS